MPQTLERELWGEINLTKYNQKLTQFSNQFGEPKLVKRLAFRFGPDNAHRLNTRIRISNGDAKLMQKLHDRDSHSAIEHELDLPDDPERVVSLFLTYRRLLAHFDDTHCYLLLFCPC